jgi:ABC-2 type transport system ATP-binding protein
MMQPTLSIRKLRKSYGDVVAVNGVDLDAAAGECLGLLGPNGAGKTTTIEICEGLNHPDGGTVELFGLQWQASARELRNRIGIQLQETQLSEKLTVEETMRMFRSFYRRGPTVDDLIAHVQLEEKRRARVGGLSGGQKQRLALACALAGDPELVFLDEPTTGLDPQARRQVWELVEGLKKGGRTVILTTHYMDEAERLCDRVAIMDQGRIIAVGTPRDLICSTGIEHFVEFALTGGNAFAIEAFSRLAGVCSVRNEDGRYQLSVKQLHLSVPAILEQLARSGAEVTELRTHSASLEDVFVSLTGRHLRDE